jgi:hypothetical protein
MGRGTRLKCQIISWLAEAANEACDMPELEEAMASGTNKSGIILRYANRRTLMIGKGRLSYPNAYRRKQPSLLKLEDLLISVPSE